MNGFSAQLVSKERFKADYHSFLLLKHPVESVLESFLTHKGEQASFYIKNKVCEFEDFSFNDGEYLLKNKEVYDNEKYNVVFSGITGHIHNTNGSIYLINDNNAYFVEDDSFIQKQDTFLSFIQFFRKNREKFRLEDTQYSVGKNLSGIIFEHSNNYYSYFEITENNIDAHHDRLGFLMKLTPSDSGVSSKKFCLINFFNLYDYFEKFKKKRDKNNFNSSIFLDKIITHINHNLI